MMAIVETYLATRRAGGFDLLNAGYLLGSFACFAAKRNETHIRAETAIDWAALGPSVAQRDARLKTVCCFARYIRAEDARHELPPANYFGNRKRRPVPYIYSTTEITRLIDAALGLGPRGTLRAQTYATLIALLACTGLRISEALHLRLADITVDGLLIRNTKFGKTRLVPLHETAAAGLGRYLVHRHQAAPSGDHVFIGRRGQSLRYQSVQSTFKRLAWKAGLPATRSGRRPRWHGLRHTFAVRALQNSPADRDRIGQHMVALATYMGHVNIYATYWYLEATPELLRDIADNGETFVCGGEQS
jgi:integrase/recombinase XerD